MPTKKFYSLLLLITMSSLSVFGQMKNAEGKIILGARIVGNDTIPHAYLPQVTIYNPDLLGMSARERRKYLRNIANNRQQYSRLRMNVYKTYPYAVMASYIVHDIDSAMLTIRSKEARKLYKNHKEKELMQQYKGELENMTMSQGRVLVILIARQTGKDCYTIIKDLKGGFNARIWQTLATLFSNNLKRNYDPEGEDATIEFICREIEASGKFVRTNI